MKIKRVLTVFTVSFIVLVLAFSAVTQANEPAKKYTIGVVVPELSNEFWQNYLKFVQKAAKELGVEIVYADAESREDKEVSLVENFVSRKVDGLLITPVTASIGPAMMRLAENAGIPVVFVERWPGIDPKEWKGKQYVGFVGGDYGVTGYKMMEILYKAGARRIVAIGGAQGNSVADALSASVKRFAEDHPDVKVLQEQRNAELRDHGLKITENFISAFPGPGFDGVWAFNDETALGAIQALRNDRSIGRVKVVGKDLIGDALDAIRNGEMIYSFGGQWAEGAFALAMLFDYLNGYEPEEKVVYVPLLGVGKDEVDRYEAQFIKQLPQYDFKALTRTYNAKLKVTDWAIKLN